MNVINFFVRLLKDPRAAIASWIAMGVGPTLGFIFLIVFIETGVVFMPFLPGDSLLFAAGVFAAPDASGHAALPLAWLLPVVWAAPILGDQCNYWIGHFFGRRIVKSGKVKALTPERIAKTEGMIEKWGPLAVFLGRFFPFIRTFMPFFSGITGMKWRRFAPFSVLGGLVWSSLFTFLGFFFGRIPAVQKHFELVIVLILLVSLAPTIIGAIRAAVKKRKKNVAEGEAIQAAEDAAGVEQELKDTSATAPTAEDAHDVQTTPAFQTADPDHPATGITSGISENLDENRAAEATEN